MSNLTGWRLSFAVLLLTCCAPWAMAFETVEAKNFAKQSFVFPAAIRGDAAQLLFLGIAKDQDNGTYQGAELIKWHKALIAAGIDPDAHKFWHFPVIENPPFFVKGLIRRGIAKDYKELLPPEQGAVLFVDDIQRFAESAGVPLDGKPTVAIYSERDGVMALFRGEVSDTAVAAIAARLENKAHRTHEPASDLLGGRQQHGGDDPQAEQ